MVALKPSRRFTEDGSSSCSSCSSDRVGREGEEGMGRSKRESIPSSMRRSVLEWEGRLFAFAAALAAARGSDWRRRARVTNGLRGFERVREEVDGRVWEMELECG